jgi:hypothetical protein
MTDDEQDVAESLDEDRVDELDDFTGDEYGEGLPSYPPERPMGVNTVGITPVEEDAGESFEERTWREERDTDDGAEPDVGQLVDGAATTQDDEPELIADALLGTEPGPEAAALHTVDEDEAES